MSATGTDTEVTRPRAGVNPYVGPRSLQEGEAIYGRMREIAELRGLLVAHRIVLLYSPSGAGKTSLIEAGLRPELQRRKFYVLPTIRVGYELSSDAAQGTANRYRASVIASLEERLPPERQLGAKELASIGLDVYLEQLDQEHPDQNPCLIFDQFEELFTLDPVDFDAKAEFLDELGLALSNRTRWALFAMREDFIAQLDPYLSSIPTGFNTRFRIGLLDPKEAKQAAKAPAAAAGVDFEDAAVDQLIEDLRQIQVQRMGKTSVEPGPNVEPVQLQVVCRRLWAHLDPEATTIGTKDAMSAGDVNEALAGYYVDEVEAVTKTGVSEKALRQWFDSQLISDDGYRNQVRTGPGKSGSEVLTDLEDAHLIRADRRRGTDWYELTHDRFVEPIRNSNRDFNARRRTKYLRRGLIAAAIVFGAVLLFVPSLFSSEGLKAEPLATDGSTVVIDLDESGVARYLFNAEARDEVVATVSSENGTVAVEIRLWVAGGELRHLAYGVRLTDLPLDTSKNEKDQAGQSLAGVEEDSKSTIQVSTLEYQFVADGEFVIEVTSTPSAKLMLESRVTEGGEFSNLDDIGADTATLSTPGDVRTYQLSAQNDNETISLTLTPTDELRGLAKIVNAQGTEINSADAAGSGESVQLVTELLTAGTYYVQVSGVDGSTGGYTLALEKGTEAEDATLSLGTPLAGSIDTEEVDEYPFEASAGQYLELSVVPTGGFDVAIEVAGPQGFFDVADSGGEGAPEVLVLVPTVDGSYLISVKGYEGSAGGYQLTVSEAVVTDISLGASLAGSIDTTEPVTFYGLEALAGQYLELSVVPTGGFDVAIEVAGPQGFFDVADFVGDGAPEVLVLVPTVDSSYLISVKGYEGSAGDYQLTVSEAVVTDISLGASLAGSIEPVTFYGLEALAGQNLELSVVPTGGFDVAIVITGPQGLFDFVDSGGEGAPEVLVLAPTVDVSYLISVRRFLGSGGDYTITLEPAN